MTRNDLRLVQRVLALFADEGSPAWLFGGWAEELLGIASPRDHVDIDLLFHGRDFAFVDALIRERGLAEIVGKHFPHKRAFLFEGVMVELFLVQEDRRGLYTDFWGSIRHDWPSDLLTIAAGLPVATAAALAGYRRAYETLRMRTA